MKSKQASRSSGDGVKPQHQELVLLTEQEVSRLLKVSRRTLQGWRLEGKGPPYFRIAGCIRYDQAELLRYIASTRRRSTSDPGPQGE